MPSGSKLPDVTSYSKAQGIETLHDSSGRLKVKIDAVSSSVSIGGSTIVTMKSVNVSYATTKATTSTTKTTALVAAQGATTSTEVRGFSVCNAATVRVEVGIRFGGTNFWRGDLAGGAAINWNFVNGYPKSAVNKAVNLYQYGVSTVVATVYWKKA